ncbi:putative dis1-suppressing protein kinase dsk1 [Diplodia corticola]|uniref:non-specific serine/threonine protein kinase n=1 Tax=Diplodia corticola TaxID=236234 RepID=A0A1J9QKZ9_9PEZI|nr:putative dis1-suppressing protein kinase dsk1 [Diplodia corticola]OJD29144.1 putative dis1-suppressing protein kinase dsk1 [Diplodia corticola]
MAMSLLNRAWRPLFGRAWKPLAFPNKGFALLPGDKKVEEEILPDYVASRYYPVRIGQIFRHRYQVVGKLGFGATSTVWLARDLTACRHVALKLFIHSESMGSELDTELDVYKRIESVSENHPGRDAVRSILDSFDVDGPEGRHRCLAHPPLWESVLGLRHRNPVRRLPAPVVAFVLQRLFQALDLLHNECRVAHTDIKEANVLLGADESVLRDFERQELADSCPRKESDGGTVYLSRELGTPRDFGAPVLCDFGSAVPLDDGAEHREDIQPDVYRAPEVILDIPWTYSVDIWNVGCVVWDAFEGEHLFTGHDPEFETYRGRAHLAEMIALLGPPPPSLLARANLRSKFFSEAGDFCAGIPTLESTPLEQRETSLEGEDRKEDRECFLRFMRKMLQWEPEKRSSARELAEDEWILKHTT